jgi:superfamily II DNA/RNA helicase
MTLNITWDDINYELDARIKEVLLDTLKFEKVMPIQKACVPIFSKNYDVAVEVSTPFC